MFTAAGVNPAPLDCVYSLHNSIEYDCVAIQWLLAGTGFNSGRKLASLMVCTHLWCTMWDILFNAANLEKFRKEEVNAIANTGFDELIYHHRVMYIYRANSLTLPLMCKCRVCLKYVIFKLK